MTISYQDAVRNLRLACSTTALGTTPFIEVFSGAPAGKTAGVYNADPGTKLASLAMSNPAAPTPTAGLLTYSTITSATGLATGTPQSYRLKTAASGAVGTVIEEGLAAIGSGDLNFASGVSSGGTVSISSATTTEGNP